MRLERERSDGRRDFWEAEIQRGGAIAINSGIVNVRNQKTTKQYSSRKEAQAALDKLVAAKRKAGFAEPVAMGSHFLPAPLPTNPELEAAIREAKEDPGPYSVYADWLQAQGSPVGELVALAAAEEKKKGARQRMLDELEPKLGLPPRDFATWGYEHGFWQWLRLENAKDWMEESFDPVAFARKLFATPLCCALDELRVGILRWDHNHVDVPAVLAAAGDYAWSKSLSRLHLGDITADIDMAHHMIGDVGAVISESFPALRWLKLHSGSQDWRGVGETFGIGGLALPRLETLVIETCAMTSARARDLTAATLPALTRLELWFGNSDRDATATVDDLAPLLDGTAFPKVRDLGLCNLDFIAPLIAALGESAIAKQLVRLDLSKGVLDETTAPQLAAIAERFPALEVLDVDDNFVTPAAFATLRAAFAHAKVSGPDQNKLQNAEDNYRYVSVGE